MILQQITQCTGSQWSETKIREICSCYLVPLNKRAAHFGRPKDE